MDAFVKWRAAELKGYAGRYLERLSIKLFCMEELESVDIYQVGDVPIETLLMVGDVNQRVDLCRSRGSRAIFEGAGSSAAHARTD